MRNQDARTAVAQFFGWLLMGVGVLIMLTAGGCSVFVLAASLGYPEGLPGTLMMILVFGGIPIAVGVALLVAGRWLAKVGQPRQLPPRRIRSEDDGSGL